MTETLKQLFSASLTYFRYNVHRTTVYGLNVAFDVLTLMVTVNLLVIYVNQRRVVRRLGIILLDIVACVIFFYSCSFLAFYADETTNGIKVPYYEFYKHVGSLFTGHDCTNYHVFTSTLLFSASVFLPTVSYLIGILFFLTAKTTLEGCRWVVRHVLELSISTDRTVFFYTGTLLGLIAATGKAFVEIGKLALEQAS